MQAVTFWTQGMVTLDIIRSKADQSIRRACGFAALGISCVLMGLAYDLPLAFQAAALLSGLVAAVLYLKSFHAPGRPFRKTELWLMLDPRPRLPDEELQKIIGKTLADRFKWHAGVAVVVSLSFGLLAGISRITA